MPVHLALARFELVSKIRVLLLERVALLFKIGYEGSKNGVSDERFASEPTLIRHGATGLVKLAPPLFERVKPFVGAGLGTSYVSTRGAPLGLYQDDIMEELPFAAGLEFNLGLLTAGVLATYRVLIRPRAPSSPPWAPGPRRARRARW